MAMVAAMGGNGCQYQLQCPAEAQRNTTEVSIKRHLRYWYYYGGFESDILVFIDFACMPQKPRTALEDEEFKVVLKGISWLYNNFEVIVVDTIPYLVNRE